MSPAARTSVLALGLVLLLPACSKGDDALRKELVGVWEGNPRAGRTPEQIDAIAFVTPDLDAFELGPVALEDNGAERGLYTHVVHRPRSAVVPSLGHELPEKWETTKGHWWVVGGEVHLVGIEPSREDLVLTYDDGKLVVPYYFGPTEGNAFTFRRGKALPTVPAGAH